MATVGEDIAAGLLGADALYQAGLDEGPEEVESALLGNGQRLPDLARGEALLVAEQSKQFLLFGAQDKLLVLPLRSGPHNGCERAEPLAAFQDGLNEPTVA